MKGRAWTRGCGSPINDRMLLYLRLVDIGLEMTGAVRFTALSAWGHRTNPLTRDSASRKVVLGEVLSPS